MTSLYLASGSPRRRELLTQIGVPFSTVSAAIDETPLVNEAATAYVERLAREKARAGYKHVTASPAVRFRNISTQEAARYWASGEPLDKAGGYAIQGLGAVFVSGLEGSYSAVVGLPVCETAELLGHFGIPCWQTLSVR